MIKSSTGKTLKVPIVYEDYRDMQTFEMKPCTDTFLGLLAEDMVKWVDESQDNLKLEQFFHSRHINYRNLHRWLPRSEALQEAHEYVLHRLGTKREIGALKREYDSAIVRTTMPHYDKTWKELEEWRSKLKEPTESGDKVVVIERFPDVPSVPERKE
jgi:hypothetical protein